MNKIIIIYFLILLGCHESKRQESGIPSFDADTTHYIRVYENANKDIYLNGNAVTLAYLEKRLIAIANNNGILYYTCINATEKPPLFGRVIDLVKNIELGLKCLQIVLFQNRFIEKIKLRLSITITST